MGSFFIVTPDNHKSDWKVSFVLMNVLFLEDAKSLFAVDDTHMRSLFGGIKDDFKNQSTKISNLQN